MLVLSAAALAAGSQNAVPQAATGRPQSITFNRDIAPIVFKHCAPCHRPGGDAPFSLLTYAAVRQRAKVIAAVTASRQMPPWKGESAVGQFEGMHLLSMEEIDAVERWTENGLLEGDPKDLPALPQWPEGWQLGAPDLIVTTTQAYTLRAAGADEYRTFVIPLPIDRARNVKGIEFRPGVAGVVHHANILLDQTPRSRELDERDPEPGYDGPLARTATNPEGHFLGYTPGRPDPLLPAGLAWRLEPDTDLIVQLHLMRTGKPEIVQPSVAFYFADRPPARTPFLMRLGRQRLDIAAGEKSYRITDSYVLPVDVEVHALKPHAHYLARELRAVATLPDGVSERLLLSIRDWDFKWQNGYRFVTPVALPRGSTITMEITYDNSADNPENPSRPPRRVRWGPASTDEMGDLWIQILAIDDAAREVLARDFRPKAAAEEVAGYRGLLEQTPNDPVLNDDIALLYLELGWRDEAVAHFERSLRARPQSAAGRYNLGTALMFAGRFEEAVDQLRQAVALNPEFAAAYNNLGNALAEQNRLDEALSHYTTALRIQPNHARAHNGIATVLMQQGRLDDAVGRLDIALALDPTLAEAHHNMGLTQQARGQYAEAARHLREAARLRPESPQMLTDCAWLLATAPDELVRDSTQSIGLGEKAAALTRRQDSHVLDVLAAAHAEAGQFDRALAVLAEAVSLNPPETVLRQLRAHQALYRERRQTRLGPAVR